MGLLRNRDYRWWFAGDTAGASAVALRAFVVPLFAFGLTGSTVLAGVVGTLTQALGTLAAIPGGVVIDRHDRLRLMRLYAASGLVIWGTITILAATRHLTYPVFVLLAGLGALLAGFFGLATDAALRSLVSTTEYPRAAAANQGRDAAVSLASGPVGGFLYGLVSWLPFATALVGYAIAGLATFGIRADLRPPAYDQRSIVGDIASAGRWIWGKPRLRHLLPMIMVVNFAVGGIFVGFQLWLLSQGFTPLQIGWLSAAEASALLLGSLIAGAVVRRIPTGALVAVTLGLLSLALVPTVASGRYGVILTSAAVGSLLIPSLNTGLLGYLFGLVPPELQGRVQSVITVAVGGLAALAPLTAGWALQALGYRTTISTFLALLMAATLAAAASRPIREIPRPDAWDTCPL